MDFDKENFEIDEATAARITKLKSDFIFVVNLFRAVQIGLLVMIGLITWVLYEYWGRIDEISDKAVWIFLPISIFTLMIWYGKKTLRAKEAEFDDIFKKKWEDA